MTEQAMTVRGENGIERDSFGSRELERRGETAPTALASAAQAEVQARYIMALQRPRSGADARVRMLTECKRPSFASVAIFKKPIGGGRAVEGLSIRFAEVAARAWGNLHVGREVISDEASKRIMRVHVTDLEANLTESVDVVIEKTVERKSLREGQAPRGRRTNSYGDLVYLVDANEGELLTKQRAEEAKVKRACVLAMIPGDILDECKRQVYLTQANEDARDPEAAKKTLFDSFAGVGVRPSDIEGYLGHSVDTLSPSELLDLRAVYTGINDGVVTWAEALFAKTGAAGDKPNPRADEIKGKIKDNLEKKRAAKAGAATKGKGLTDDRRAAIAEQAGTTQEVVAKIERYAAGGESEATIARALRVEGTPVDEPTIADVLAQIRKGGGAS